MSYYFDIFAALQKPIQDSANFGIDWSFENDDFDPSSALDPWGRLTTLPAQPIPTEIGAVLTDIISGVTQIDLFYPAGRGRGAALSKADEILSVYRRNANLAYGDAQVRIESSGISQGADNNPWYHVYITIVWREFRCYAN